MAAEEVPALELLVNGAGWVDRAYLNSAAEGLLLRSCADAVQR